MFHRFATRASCLFGSPLAFILALAIVVVWGASGFLLGFTDTWQLLINTPTTIVTFLMVFLIQHTQNRDTESINIKLDEILRALQGAREGFALVNDMSDEDRQNVRESLRKAIEHGTR